jgi:hypothetical protein
MIIGGHSHTILDQPAKVNGVLITQAGEGTKQIGRFDIVVDDITNSIIKYDWGLVPIAENTIKPDKDLQKYIDSYSEVVDAKYNSIVCKLSTELTTAIAKDGPAKALTVCSVRAPQIASEVGKDHKVTIRRATNQPRNPKNIATDAEKTALSTFAAALVEKSPPKPQIITNSDDSRTFLAPIVISTPLCLQCHGNPANDIAKPTLDAIRKLYPDDKATGYQLGDLRGLWSITFPPEK